MAEAGVRPAHARTEPVDSVFLELDFLAHLYARWGETLRLESEGEPAPDGSSEEWASCIASFASDHALKWLPSFMRQVRERSRLAAYRELADLGLFYLEELGKDADVFSAKEEVPA